MILDRLTALQAAGKTLSARQALLHTEASGKEHPKGKGRKVTEVPSAEFGKRNCQGLTQLFSATLITRKSGIQKAKRTKREDAEQPASETPLWSLLASKKVWPLILRLGASVLDSLVWLPLDTWLPQGNHTHSTSSLSSTETSCAGRRTGG